MVRSLSCCCCCLFLFWLQDLEYDNLHNPVNFINKYIVLPKNFTGDDVLSFVLDKDDLDEGEWQGCYVVTWIYFTCQGHLALGLREVQ